MTAVLGSVMARGGRMTALPSMVDVASRVEVA